MVCDVLKSDLVGVVKEERICRRKYTRGRAAPDQVHLLRIFGHFDHRGCKPCGVRKHREKPCEELPDLGEPRLRRELLLCMVEGFEDRCFGVIEHDLVDILSSERREMIVPGRLYRRSTVPRAIINSNFFCWTTMVCDVLKSDLVGVVKEERICRRKYTRGRAAPDQVHLLRIFGHFDHR